jgi:hypothetical protein
MIEIPTATRRGVRPDAFARRVILDLTQEPLIGRKPRTVNSTLLLVGLIHTRCRRTRYSTPAGLRVATNSPSKPYARTAVTVEPSADAVTS